MLNFLNKFCLLKYIGKVDQKNIDNLFARYFSTEEGEKVLAYLQHITFDRPVSPTTSHEQIHFYDGRRDLFLQILRIINRGQNY